MSLAKEICEITQTEVKNSIILDEAKVIKIKLDLDDLRRLQSYINGDPDTADKQAINEIVFRLAELAGLKVEE